MKDNGSNLGTYSMLYAEMESALIELELQKSRNDGYSSLIKLVRNYIAQIKEATEQPFIDEQEEITFFRDIWPKFYGKLFYYQLINAFEMDREGKSPESQIRLITEVHEVIEDFYLQHKMFLTYYRGDSDPINSQFTRKYSRSCLLDPMSDLLYEWGTIAGYTAAWAIAYAAFNIWLQQIKTVIESDGAAKWEWHETKTSLVELTIGLAGTGSLFCNGQPANAAQIRHFFQTHFHIDLTDFNKLIYATDIRKKGEPSYFTRLQMILVERRHRLGK